MNAFSRFLACSSIEWQTKEWEWKMLVLARAGELIYQGLALNVLVIVDLEPCHCLESEYQCKDGGKSCKQTPKLQKLIRIMWRQSRKSAKVFVMWHVRTQSPGNFPVLSSRNHGLRATAGRARRQQSFCLSLGLLVDLSYWLDC
jgi:hypothetical protein